MVRKISDKISEETLKEDLEKYRKLAIELGATDAKVITTDMVSVDDRVRIKCVYPKCSWYNTNRNCPPFAMDVSDTRTMVSGFHYAIAIRQKMPASACAGDRTPEDFKIYAQTSIKQHEIISKLESAAFYDGYYLAVGFGGGPCKLFFCPTTECAALKPGQGCKHALKAHSSMEAVGLDAYLLAAKLDWDMYPIGMSKTEAPHSTRIGIVFIY